MSAGSDPALERGESERTATGGRDEDRETGWWGGAARSIAQVAVGVGLIAALLYVVDVGDVARLIAAANLPPLLAAAVASFGDRLFMIGKWYPLLRVQETGVSPITAGRAYFAAGFASIFLPASVGGDVLRAIALGRAQKKVVEVGASIIVERVLGLLGAGLVSVMAAVLAFRAGIRLDFVLPWAGVAVGVAVGALAAPALVTGESRVGRWLARHDHLPGVGLARRFARGYALYRHRAGLVAVVAGLSTVEQLMPVAVLWLTSLALDASIQLHMLLVAVPLTMFVARLPIAAWGLGVMEGALVYLLGLFGVPPAEALAVSLCGRMADVVAMLPGAFLWRDLIRPRTHDETAAGLPGERVA